MATAFPATTPVPPNVGTGSTSMYDEVLPFFGNDSKGRLFTALNYKGNKFDVPLNTKEYPESIKSECIYQLMLAKNYFKLDASGAVTNVPAATSDNVLSDAFAAFVSELGKIHEDMDDILSGDVTAGKTARIAATRKEMTIIYNNWSSLQSDTRDFYSQLMNLVQNEAGAGLMTNPTSTIPTAGFDLTTSRLNFKKVDKTNKSSEVLFGFTLPYLPQGMILESDVNKRVLSVDYLHQLYQSNRGRNALVGGSNARLFEGWVEYGLNVDAFLKNCLKTEEAVSRGRVKIESPLDEYYDLITDKLYSVNKKGEIVNADGTVMDDAKYESDIKSGCAGTGIKDCPLVFECLLRGDSAALSRCLGKLSNENMFAVAKSEVNKMNPRVISKLLSTFNIKFDSKSKQPEEFLVWRGELESRLRGKMGAENAAKTASAILGNKKLIEYLRNMIEVIRTNPLLTHGYQATLSDLPDKTNNGIKEFRKPVVDRTSSISSQLAALNQQFNMFPSNFVSGAGFTMPINFANTRLASPGDAGLLSSMMGVINPWGAGMSTGMGMGMPMGWGMRGGGNCVDETVATLESIYNSILQDLNNNGKSLVQEDQDKIVKAIGQIKKNNTYLITALNDLRAFTKLNKALTVGLDKVSIRDVTGSQNINLGSQVNGIQDQLNRTARDNFGLVTTLTDIFRAMSSLSAGVASPFFRPIN
jgi:hypothetical protein